MPNPLAPAGLCGYSARLAKVICSFDADSLVRSAGRQALESSEVLAVERNHFSNSPTGGPGGVIGIGKIDVFLYMPLGGLHESIGVLDIETGCVTKGQHRVPNVTPRTLVE